MTGAVRTVTRLRVTSRKLEGPSLRAPSFKLQATSFKPRATSIKLQAASGKLSNIFPVIKFPVSSGEGLYQDKCILRMCHVERNLVWTQPYGITTTHFKLNCKKLLVLIVTKYIRKPRNCQIFDTIPTYCWRIFLQI